MVMENVNLYIIHFISTNRGSEKTQTHTYTYTLTHIYIAQLSRIL